MHILQRGALVLVLTSLLCTSCADPASSVSLALPTDMQEAAAHLSSTHTSGRETWYVPLKALNKNARAGIISTPTKADAMYFAFEKSPDILDLTGSALYALELEFEPLAPAAKSSGTGHSDDNQKAAITGTVQTGSIREDSIAFQIDYVEFAAGLLYANDFSASGKLKENIRPRHPVTAQMLPHKAFTVRIGFAGMAVQAVDIRGFMVSSQMALKLKSAAIVPVRYGWLKDGTALWYGTSADGGLIPPELCTESGVPLRTEFAKPSAVVRTEYAGRGGRDTIVIHFDDTLPVDPAAEQKQPCLSFQCGSKGISVYRAPELYRLTLDGCLFPDSFLRVEQTDTDRLTDTDMLPETSKQTDMETMVCGITTEYTIFPLLSPIIADPGLIPDWPQERWRQPSYELFRWEQFPSVLIFDFADYSVQDAYLKRLSFFAEKKGFTGKLLFDGEIASLHGFNAHDYRAETLAAFFQKAENEHFPLNNSELHLRSILFHNGIIIRTEQGIEAGNGAIVSLSRQSPTYLRYRFITHECLHGIYFTQESFRNTVEQVFQQTDPRAVLFLRRYFEVYPSLQYNTDDDYLLQNEFMAYLLQQGSAFLQEYYSRITWFRAMNEAEPALCRYMRNTGAEDFLQAAAQMSSFLYTTWGLRAGRIHLARMETL